MREQGDNAADQAAGLRRLFGAVPARLAPILADPADVSGEVAAIVRLAQACANAGERTLVVDCARAQVAASLGLRARFDLLHALRGECDLNQARLDAGANLGVVPAARAATQKIATNGRFLQWLTEFARATATDLVLLIVEPAQAALLHGTSQPGEMLVPMPRRHAAWSGILRAIAMAGDRTDIAGFRLLFPAWDAVAAARLYEELVQACADRLAAELRFGGAMAVARDWPRVPRAMEEWELARLPRPQTVRTF